MAKRNAKQGASAQAAGPGTGGLLRTILLDWGVALGLAVALAVAIKWVIMDVYSIPTGSMEPVLSGREHSGDRIFCFKQAYRFRERPGPRRWEVFVFHYPATDPGDEKAGVSYIKRCVGLPGETVYVRDGDLYVKRDAAPLPTRATKPATLQDSLWIPVHRHPFGGAPERALRDALAYHWDLRGPETALRFGEGAMTVEAATAPVAFRYRGWTGGEPEPRGITDRHVKRQVVTFECPEEDCDGRLRKTVKSQQLSAFCPVCGALMTEADIDPETFEVTGIYGRGGSPPRRMPLHAVRDLAVTIGIEPLTENGRLELALEPDDARWTAHFPFGPGPATIRQNGEVVASAGVQGLGRTGELTEIRFARWDGLLTVRIDGVEQLRHEIDGPMPSAWERTKTSDVEVALSGQARVTRLDIDRDLHYFYQKLSPEDRLQYFANFRNPAAGARRRMMLEAQRMSAQECYIVRPGGYLAFGDNQPTSNDSRIWGPVPEANLVGPALFIWWPPHRAAILE